MLVLGAEPEEEASAVTTSSSSTTTTSPAPTTVPLAEGAQLVMTETPWWLPAWYAEDMVPGPPIMTPGWAWVDAVPVEADRPVAAVWTGREIFVWVSNPLGWMTFERSTLRGLLYDPAEGSWRGIAPMSNPDCMPAHPVLLTVGGDVILYTHGGPAFGCSSAIGYDPDEDAWSGLPVGFSLAGAPFSLVSTGDMLVSTTGGQAIVWETGDIIETPALDTTQHRLLTQRPVWDGEQVVVLGEQALYTWRPGDDTWETVEEFGSLLGTAGMAATGAGVLVLDRHEGGAFLSDGEWHLAPDLYWTNQCTVTVEPTSVPLVRFCSGLSTWDEQAERWVPIPVPGLAHGGLIVDAGGEIYAIDRYLRRLTVRSPDGSITVPGSIPFATGAYLDVPDGFEYLGALGPSVRPPVFEAGVDTTAPLGIGVAQGDVSCTIVELSGVTTGSQAWLDYPDRTEVTVSRPGLRAVDALTATSPDGAAYAALPNGFVTRGDGFGGGAGHGGSMVVVRCESDNLDASRIAATDLLAGLWHPGEGLVQWWPPGRQGNLLWESADGLSSLSLGLSGVPTLGASMAAEAAFRLCAIELVGGQVALAPSAFLVSAANELLHVTARMLRPESWPPIVSLDDEQIEGCFDRARVTRDP